MGKCSRSRCLTYATIAKPSRSAQRAHSLKLNFQSRTERAGQTRKPSSEDRDLYSSRLKSFGLPLKSAPNFRIGRFGQVGSFLSSFLPFPRPSRSIETRSLATLARCFPRSFAFHVTRPNRSIQGRMQAERRTATLLQISHAHAASTKANLPQATPAATTGHVGFARLDL